MGYSGANEAKGARESLGKTLEALQQEADIPDEVLEVAQNVARAVGALFEAQFASTEPDGKACVKSALGTLSQTLALLQDVKSEHGGVLIATEGIAEVISQLFPLTNRPSARPESQAGNDRSSARPSGPPSGLPSAPPTSSRPASVSPSSRAPAASTPASRPPTSAPPSRPPSLKPSSAPPVIKTSVSSSRPVSAAPAAQASSAPPSVRPVSSRPVTGAPISSRPSGPSQSAAIPTSMLPPPAPVPVGDRRRIEANLGATTQSNFYVGFSGEIAHGGVFLATYESLDKDTSVSMLVTLPGGFEFQCDGYVRFVRDPMDFASESEPGMGVQFEGLSDEARELALRFVRQRAPMFYDV
ncbi:MAG: hypothetical protein AAF500_14690 [Myxococcota bacterium]